MNWGFILLPSVILAALLDDFYWGIVIIALSQALQLAFLVFSLRTSTKATRLPVRENATGLCSMHWRCMPRLASSAYPLCDAVACEQIHIVHLSERMGLFAMLVSAVNMRTTAQCE